jgi:hypothetical protein
VEQSLSRAGVGLGDHLKINGEHDSTRCIGAA